MSDYEATVNYLYQNLPMFQRVGASAFKKDLTNTLALCEALGHPQNQFKSIHIAGTNGKGSSSHMLASILQEAGYKTGLYTSPHLKEFTERIKVNGQEVTRDFVVSFVHRIKPTIERVQPSFFEITVAMAFQYFAEQKVDIAVIEVGLGGRLDSTNVITPIMSLITNIGWDHMDLLGDTLPKIAFEKAGIIKPNVPVVISEKQADVFSVFEQKARETKSSLVFAPDVVAIHSKGNGRYTVQRQQNSFEVQLDLKGNYQIKNLAGVLATVDQLRVVGYNINDDHLLKGLSQTITNTNLKGRWQQLSAQPLIICDTGHNVDGMREVVQQIAQQNYHHLWMVIGMVKDKDVSKVLQLLPKEASYFFCQAKIPRAMDADELQIKASDFGLRGMVVRDINEAIRQAKKLAQTNDVIFIGGSTFVVAEIDNL